jgi:hypothetical protein
MNEFLKDNIAIVAAIVLPVLLAIVFALSTLFSGSSVDAPKHDFLMATNYVDGSTSVEFSVANDKVVVTSMPIRKDTAGNTMYTHKPRLWRVHVPEMTAEEISFNHSGDGKSGPLAIPALENLKIRNLQPGPDGYIFENYYYSGYNSSLMAEIFSSRNERHQTAALVKENRAFLLKTPRDTAWDYNTRFIGWVMDGE